MKNNKLKIETEFGNEIFLKGDRVYLRPFSEISKENKQMLLEYGMIERLPFPAIITSVSPNNEIIMLEKTFFMFPSCVFTHMPSCPICRKYPYNQQRKEYDFLYGTKRIREKNTHN